MCIRDRSRPASAHIPSLSRPSVGPACIGISRPLSLGPRPLRRTTEDHEFIGSDIDQSTQLVINYKHHRIGSSLPSPNISRAAPRSYAHQSHVYAQNHHTMTRATGLYKSRTPAPTTWRCPRSQIRTRTRRPTKVCAACTPGKHAQAASQTLFMHQLGVIRVSLVTLQKSLKLIHKTNRFVFTGVHSFYT